MNSVQASAPTQFGQSTLNVWAMLKAMVFNGVGILVFNGTPVNGASGTGTYVGRAGKGSLLIDYSTGNMYVNLGTKSSVIWTAIGPAVVNGVSTTPRVASGSITAAQIISTAVGDFGHANGVPLVAAQGAHNVIVIESVVMAYDFGVAAYTAGGNITVNNSGGGAALTGLVSAANSVGAASDKVITFVPLAAAGNAAVENGGINLVTSAAFTNPGTATGVINWVANYRVIPTSLT